AENAQCAGVRLRRAATASARAALTTALAKAKKVPLVTSELSQRVQDNHAILIVPARWLASGCRSIHDLKVPSSKFQRNPKSQAPKALGLTVGYWSLKFLWCLDVGAWRLSCGQTRRIIVRLNASSRFTGTTWPADRTPLL